MMTTTTKCVMKRWVTQGHDDDLVVTAETNGEKFQILLKKELMNKMGLKTGDRFEILA